MSTTPTDATGTSTSHRYDASLANAIETKWQDRWEADDTFHAPNPGEPGFERFDGQPKQYILDMFPYPSGVGLHVGHPLGYIATDIYARYLRAKGNHVLHAMGFDAFGLPAEQYAVEHGVHPRVTTENNIANMRAQLRRLGLAHDAQRSVATTDTTFYRWTQWIFLQIYNAWFDEEAQRARPISELIDAYQSGTRETQDGAAWSSLSEDEQARIIDTHRLAYAGEVPVNWCPALGTVLANEEVTADGKSERGDHPVYKRPLKQWMMRITAYNERLLAELESVRWPEPIKLMQRNWIGRSEGASVDFPADRKDVDAWFSGRRAGGWSDDMPPDEDDVIRIFTTRPDTLFGATYMVLSPEHPMVDRLVTDVWPEGTQSEWTGRFPKADATRDDGPRAQVAAYRKYAAGRSDVERQIEAKDKTGVFIGAYAVNPVNRERVPIFVADYVLMGYGTGAIMAVPAHDERDFEFASQFGLPIPQVVRATDGSLYATDCATPDPGIAMNSSNDEVSLDGMPTAEAKRVITAWLNQVGTGAGAVNYKLRDWLFSRQRYWGEPFPIVYDDNDRTIGLDASMLPVELPELSDFRPRSSDDPNAPPEPPLGRASDWTHVEIDGKTYRRELNTMPQWAGSCWYYLRYLDPNNGDSMVDPAIEQYWMLTRRDGKPRAASETTFDPETHHSGGVDLYVGGAEHAVLHLLYARFWHKVLFDLGHVSTPEPFGRLFNQGYIQAYAYTDARGVKVPAEEVEETDDGQYLFNGEPVNRSYGKMGKSLKNAVTPDEMCEQYGCDTLRLYEMSMGPLEQSKPWSTRDVIGSHRFLQRVWRNFIDPDTGDLRVTDDMPSDETRKLMHKTIDKVDHDMRTLGFNTAIAAMIEFNNALVQLPTISREVAEGFVKMLAPFVPHVAEELWSRLGHDSCVTFEPFPVADPAILVDDQIELVVQVLGKVRGKVTIPADADEDAAKSAAMSDPKVQSHLEGKTVRKVIYVPGRLINFVAN